MYQGGVSQDGDGTGAGQLAGRRPFAHAATLYGSPTKLASYDMLILNCEGGQFASSKSPYLANMEAYMNAGGKVFFSHLHFYWLNHGSDDLQGTANYIGVGCGPARARDRARQHDLPEGRCPRRLAQVVGATTTRGQLSPIEQGQHSVSGVFPPTQEWIYVPMNPNEGN